MKRNSWLKLELLAVAAVFVLATALFASAQAIPPQGPSLSPQLGPTILLTSFDPDSPILNPKFPVSITLKHTVVGSPTHYRFSRFSDFRDARWLPYAPAPVAQIPASWFVSFTPPEGSFNLRVILYFQVRDTNPKAGRPISRTTNPLTGKTTIETEPQFLNSNVRNKPIIAGFAG